MKNQTSNMNVNGKTVLLPPQPWACSINMLIIIDLYIFDKYAKKKNAQHLKVCLQLESFLLLILILCFTGSCPAVEMGVIFHINTGPYEEHL